MQPAELPETLMPISAEAPGISFPTATQAFLCYVPGLCTCLLVSSLHCGAVGGRQAWIKDFSPSKGIFFPKDTRLEGCSGLPARLPTAPRAGARSAAVWALVGLARSRAGEQVTAAHPPSPALAGFGAVSSGRCSEEREQQLGMGEAWGEPHTFSPPTALESPFLDV